MRKFNQSLKNGTIRSCPFFQDHIYIVNGWQPNIWGFVKLEKIPRGSWVKTPNIGLLQCPVGFFLRYALEKTGKTSLGAGYLKYTPLGPDFSSG